MGPVLLQLLPIAEEFQLDCFAVSVMPLHAPPQEIIASLQTTNLLWVIEEHVERGGLAEHLALLLSVAGISFRTHHSHAVGYTDTNYGSQAFHLKESGLDHDTLKRKAGELSHLKP
jgi:transketolase C-terminal domain/subunit